MDLLTVIVSTLCAIPVQFGIMFLVYSRWILPAIDRIVSDVPNQVRTFVEPFVNEKLEDVQKTVKMSNVRFQRTINNAVNALDMDGIDLETEEGVEEAKNQLLAKNYPMNVAVEAITKILSSIEASKTASNSKEGATTW